MARAHNALDRTGASDATLALAVLDADVRARRNADAVSYLERTGNADLIEVLGLDGRKETGEGPLSRTCTVCGAAVGARCENQDRSGVARRFHRARTRAAAEPS